MHSLRLIPLACLVLMGTYASAVAQPTVTGLEGALSQGQQIAIYGSSFGFKSHAAPLRWDDFQNGEPSACTDPPCDPGYIYTNGNVVMIDRDMLNLYDGVFDTQPYECKRPYYSNVKQRFAGDVCVAQDFWSAPLGCGSGRALCVLDQESTVWYVSFWAYQDDYAGTARYNTNNKIRSNFTTAGSGYNDTYFQWRWDEYWDRIGTGLPGSDPESDNDIIWENPGGHAFGYDCRAQAGDFSPYGLHDTWGIYRDIRNRWVRTEVILDLGDPGIANGLHAGYYNGEAIFEAAGVFTPANIGDCALSDKIGTLQIGHYFRSSDNPPPRSFPNATPALMVQYISELYVDHSCARVEIGNAPTWNACTHREIQIPTAWNNNSITVTGNVGTFTTGTQVYLFVVDENRQPSVGFPVIIGEDNQQGDLGVPGVPGTVTFTQIED